MQKFLTFAFTALIAIGGYPLIGCVLDALGGQHFLLNLLLSPNSTKTYFAVDTVFPLLYIGGCHLIAQEFTRVLEFAWKGPKA